MHYTKNILRFAPILHFAIATENIKQAKIFMPECKKISMKKQFRAGNFECYFGCARTTNLDMTFDIAPFVLINPNIYLSISAYHYYHTHFQTYPNKIVESEP